MMRKFLNVIKHAFPAERKQCAVIEKTDRGFAVTEAYFTDSDRIFTVKKHFGVRRIEEYKKRLPFKKDYLVAALDEASATTVQKTIRIKRADPETPMQAEELEELAFRAFWEFLNRYRGWAAKKMETPETDLILANFEVMNAGVGKYKIINPGALSGKDFFLELRGTFVSRALLPDIEHLRKLTKRLFIVEGNAALSTFIAERDGIAVYCGYEETSAFAISEEECVFSEKLPWRFGDILLIIEKAFGVEREVAKDLFSRYTEKRVSKRVGVFFEKTLRTALGKLSLILDARYKKAGQRIHPSVHLNCYFPLPEETDILKLSKQAALQPLDKEKERLNIEISGGKISAGTALFLFYPFSYPTIPSLMKTLNRRVKWLIAYTNQ